MNLNELGALVKWTTAIGIKTSGELHRFQESVCYTNKKAELLDKLNGCFVYNITFKENT